MKNKKEPLTVLKKLTLEVENDIGKNLIDFFRKLGFQEGTLYLSNPSGKKDEFVISSNNLTEPIYASVTKGKRENTMCLKMANFIKKVDYRISEQGLSKISSCTLINPKEKSIVEYRDYNGENFDTVLTMTNNNGERINIISGEGVPPQFSLEIKNALAERMMMLSFPVDSVAVLQIIHEILQHKLKEISYLGIQVRHQKDAKYSEEEIVIKNGVIGEVTVTHNGRKMNKTNGPAWNLNSQNFSVGANEEGDIHYQITSMKRNDMATMPNAIDTYDECQKEVEEHAGPIRKRIASILEEQK